MVKVNFCYRTKCSQVGKRPKRWDLGSLWDKQTVSQFDEKLREQGVGITNMDWKMLATTVKDVAESIIGRESPQPSNQSYLSAHTKELILEAKICDGEQAKLIRKTIYRSKRADYRNYVAECTELIRQANDQHNMREVHQTVRKLTGKKRVQSNLAVNSNGCLFLCEKDQLEEWASYFELKFAGDSIPSPEDDEVLSTTSVDNDLIKTPSLAEVEKAVYALKTQCACRVDDIPAEFWRAPQACQALHATICSVWHSEELPDDWFCGEMITI